MQVWTSVVDISVLSSKIGNNGAERATGRIFWCSEWGHWTCTGSGAWGDAGKAALRGGTLEAGLIQILLTQPSVPNQHYQAVFLLIWTRFSIAWNKKQDIRTALEQLHSVCTSNSNKLVFKPLTAHYHVLKALFLTLSGNIDDAHDDAGKAQQYCNVMSDDLTIPVRT